MARGFGKPDTSVHVALTTQDFHLALIPYGARKAMLQFTDDLQNMHYDQDSTEKCQGRRFTDDVIMDSSVSPSSVL